MADKNNNKTGGRQKGSLNKRSQQFIDKLQELDCDPQSFLAQVMVGEEPSLGIHPFHSWLKRLVLSMGDRQAPTPEEWAELLDQAEKLLGYSQASLGERIGIAKELLQYISPKLRSIEIDASVDIPQFDVLAEGAKALLELKLVSIKESTKTMEIA